MTMNYIIDNERTDKECMWLNDVTVTNEENAKLKISSMRIYSPTSELSKLNGFEQGYAELGTINLYGSNGILFSRHEYNFYYDFKTKTWIADCISCGEWYDLEHDEAQEVAEELGLTQMEDYLCELVSRLA